MNILLSNRQKALSLNMKQVRRLVFSFLDWKKIKCDEVSLHFVNKKEIARLHEKFFNDPSPTDCISFPIDSPESRNSGYSILGEIFVCPEVGIEYAKKEGLDPYREVSLYIIHGLLHLLGYDDQDEQAYLVMRDEEKSAMDYLHNNKELLG